MTTELQPLSEQSVTDFRPRSFHEALKFCEFISKSDLVPMTYRGKPADIFTAIQAGAELGFSPMQALHSLIVIQGRPSMYSDAMLALVQASGKMEWIKEWAEGETAYCETKRLGYPDAYRVLFSQADAQRMGLDKKAGAWTQTPGRMRQHRARAFNLRDQYADVLRGMGITEELEDVETAKQTANATLSAEKGNAVLAKIEIHRSEPRREDAARVQADPQPVPDVLPSSEAPAPSHQEADLAVVLQDLMKDAEHATTIQAANEVLSQASVRLPSIRDVRLVQQAVATRIKALTPKKGPS